METRSILCRAHVDAIREAIEAWKADQGQAQTVLDVEDLIQECISTHDLIQGWSKRAWKMLFTDPGSMPVQQIGHDLRAVLSKFIDLLPRVRDAMNEVPHNGCKIEKLQAIDSILTSGQKTLADLESRWPFIDYAMIEQSLAEFARGEYVTGEEVFRDLLGDSPDQSAR